MRAQPTADEKATYRRDGFVALPGLLDGSETDALTAAVEGAMAGMGRLKATGEGGTGYSEGKPWLEEESSYYANALRQRINLWRVSEHVRNVMLGPEIGRLCAELAGIEGIRCYHDQALFKPAWGNPTSWHLDNPYWAFTSPDAISIWIALDDATVENGCLWYLPGSHRRSEPRNVGINENFGDLIQRVQPHLQDIAPVPVPLKRGGAVIHNGMVAHAAGCNISGRVRRAMTCAYMPDGAVYNGTTTILPPSYVHRLRVGDPLVDESIVPLVWRAESAVSG